MLERVWRKGNPLTLLVGMSLLFNMLSRLVITFLPVSKRLLISWLQSPSAVILEPRKIKSVTVSTVSHLFTMKWWDLDYTVKVRNRLKGLDLIDRVPEELWMEIHDTVQKAVIKTTLKKKKCKKAKWLSEWALQIAEKRKHVKGEGEKERYTHLNAVSKNSKER